MAHNEDVWRSDIMAVLCLPWARCLLIDVLVLLYSPWQWSVGFAVFKGAMHKYAYWNTWERMALMVVIFVLGQHLIPIFLMAMFIGGRALFDWIAGFAVSKTIFIVLDYTLWPVVNAAWVFLQCTTPVFLQLVFVPRILPEIIKDYVEKAMCLRLRLDTTAARKMRHEMQNLTEQAENHKEEIAFFTNRHIEIIDAKNSTIGELRAELKKCNKTTVTQSAEIKRLKDENKHHSDILNTRLTNLRHELTVKSDACKANLNAQIDLLTQELAQRREDKAVYERNAQNIKTLHERKAMEMDSRLNCFAQTLQTVEALYHKLITKLRPTEVGAAIAVLEESIRQRESEALRMADKVRSLEDQMTKTERQHKAAVEKMQEELKQKDAQLTKLTEQGKKVRPTDPNTHLNRCDKQLLLNLAKSQDFMWNFRTFLQSSEFEPFIKGYMKLEVQHQHLFRWMMSVIDDAKIDKCVHYTFGQDHALLSTMTTGIIEPTLLSTPRRVELTKKNTNTVLLALHPDKLTAAPAWLRTLRGRMLMAFQNARDVLG